MERTQFTFYESFFKAISRIKKDADRCKAYDAICSYALYGEEPDIERLPDSAAIAFELSKPNLDASRRKAQNGKKGGESKQAESKSQAKPNQTASKKEKEKENKKENECYNPLPPKGVFEEFAKDNAVLLSALKAFEAMRNRIKRPMSEDAKKRLVGKLQRLSQDPNVWVAMLNQSEDKCWLDVFELKTEHSGGRQPNYQPSDDRIRKNAQRLKQLCAEDYQPDAERIRKNNEWLDKFLAEQESEA